MRCLFLPIMLSIFACGQEPAPQTAGTPRISVAFPVSTQGTPVTNVAILPSLPPLPQSRTSLLGGTIANLDAVRDGLTLLIFGGGTSKILFDARTRIYMDGQPAQSRDLHDGQRVHIDALTEGSKIVAKDIYILTKSPENEDYGQVEHFNPHTGDLVLVDALSGSEVHVRLTPEIVIHRRNNPDRVTDLPARSLVMVSFRLDKEGQAVARDVVVLAEPGESFPFLGRVIQLDLSRGLLVLEDSEMRRHELYCDRSLVSNGLHEGSTIEAATRFDGERYTITKLSFVP